MSSVQTDTPVSDLKTERSAHVSFMAHRVVAGHICSFAHICSLTKSERLGAV